MRAMIKALEKVKEEPGRKRVKKERVKEEGGDRKGKRPTEAIVLD